jgi:hypothetical protein
VKGPKQPGSISAADTCDKSTTVGSVGIVSLDIQSAQLIRRSAGGRPTHAATRSSTLASPKTIG